MNALDLIAGLIIGGYMVGAVTRGKTADLIALAKRDAAFLKWAVALASLFYLRQLQDVTGIADGLIAAAIIAFLLLNVGPITTNARTILASLKGNAS